MMSTGMIRMRRTGAKITNVEAPSPRAGATAVWTGSRMIIWGGIGDTDNGMVGGEYLRLHLFIRN